MLLAIDAGNTNIVFAVCDGAKIVAQWRAATRSDRTADDYAVWMSQLLALQKLTFAHINAAIIGSVVPNVLFDLRQFCHTYLHCDPLVIGTPGVELGIGNKANRPEAVGADRLLNAVAVHQRYPGVAAIVVDFGTATNFDVVSENGDYEGGVIAPGVNLSIDALYRAAAMLPRVAIARTEKVIGKDTVPAMQSGLYWGYVSLIDGIIARIKKECGKPMSVIATGGLASLFQKEIAAIKHTDPDLTIQGLMHVHALNTKAGSAQ